jgi:hypothetical protein
MIGDQGPFFVIQQTGGQVPSPPGIPPDRPPGLPSPGARSLLAPSVRGFKIAENQSPIPQDRIYYNFNYFEDVNARLNQAFNAPIADVKVYRHVFGLEKTIFGGEASLGARLPLNTIYAADRNPPIRTGGNSTDLGDLTVFGKMILRRDPRTGSLVTVGLAITPPTGPGQFAGASFIGGPVRIHNTTIQPFLGYHLNFGNLFLHGFSALDVAVDPRDVTILYNDVGLGYYLLRGTHTDAILTAVVPTVEAHVNTPLNHRDEYNLFDPTGTPDILNITSGINFEFYRRAVLTFGFVTPVTGPRPFDFETVLLLNLRFGGATVVRPSIVPMIGG